jgi:protein O-GlcNAc transferase
MFSPALQRALDDARAGKLVQAIADVRRIVNRQPRDINALLALSLLLMQDGQVEQAAHHLSRCVELAPDAPQARSNYAGVLMRLGRSAQAAEQLRRAVAISPSTPDLWMNLSTALLQMSDAAGAVDAARRGLALAPGSSTISLNLAIALERLGKPDEGLDIAEKAHRAHPGDARLHSQYLLMLNSTDRPATTITAAHREFGELHPTVGPPAATDPDPERELRIGWLSSDLRTHSVAYFAEALFEHAPAWATTHVFSLRPDAADPVAKRLRGFARDWNAVGHLDDEAMNLAIRVQRIDILIETGGHTGDNRITALVRKPAPLIISAIGYPNTTGLGAIDARLVDSITDPAGSEDLASERLIRVDPCFLCYRPLQDAPDPAMPDAAAPITFASFNASHKISPSTVGLWRGVLDAVPGSRLLLKSSDLRDADSGEAVLSRLAAGGIDPSRVEVVRGTPGVREHLAMYSRMNIALDTSPYNGTTTTCEALWMGVPVVTSAGDRHAARVSASLVSAAGHAEWVAATTDDFGRIAAGLARDRERLKGLRESLRVEMRASPLCDAPAYAGRVYGALRELWRGYCRSREARS